MSLKVGPRITTLAQRYAKALERNASNIPSTIATRQLQAMREGTYTRLPHNAFRDGWIDTPSRDLVTQAAQEIFSPGQKTASIQTFLRKEFLEASPEYINSLSKEEILEGLRALSSQQLHQFITTINPQNLLLILNKVSSEEGISLNAETANALIKKMSGEEALVLIRILTSGQEGLAQALVPDLELCLNDQQVKTILKSIIAKNDGEFSLPKAELLLFLHASILQSEKKEEPLSFAAQFFAGSFAAQSVEQLGEQRLLATPSQKQAAVSQPQKKPTPVKRDVPLTVSIVDVFNTTQICDEKTRAERFVEIAKPLLSDEKCSEITKLSIEQFLEECRFSVPTLSELLITKGLHPLQAVIGSLLTKSPSESLSAKERSSASGQFAYLGGEMRKVEISYGK